MNRLTSAPMSKNEWAKMLSGERYDATHPDFIKKLEYTREKIWLFNSLSLTFTKAE